MDELDPPQIMEEAVEKVVCTYETVECILKYLGVQDLLNASRVCTLWNDVANRRSLWKTVRVKKAQVCSFRGMAKALKKHKTKRLDLRKMLLPRAVDEDYFWRQFSVEIRKVDSLRTIELRCCPAFVVEQLVVSNPKLEVINADSISCFSINLSQIACHNSLQKLRLNSEFGINLKYFTIFTELKQLKHLSLTSVRDLNNQNIEGIAHLVNLESLELGDCFKLRETFGSQILIKLVKLERLRLETDKGTCNTLNIILDAVKCMPHMKQLELVNFHIGIGFDTAIGACTNIKELLIVPSYKLLNPIENDMILGGVLRLQSTLSRFVWGILTRLDDKEIKDCIPVLSSIPLLKKDKNITLLTQEQGQVEYLPIPMLQRMFEKRLPTTCIKILRLIYVKAMQLQLVDSFN